MAKTAGYWEKRAAFYARKHGIDPRIFKRQIRQESGFRVDARSPAGALGIAQIVPKWHPGVDPMNPEAALDYAAGHMSSQVKKYGNYRDALAVYNSGRPWAVSQKFGETNNYVKVILGSTEKPTPLRMRGTVSQTLKPTAIPSIPSPKGSIIPSQAMGTLNDIFRKVGLAPLDIVGDIPLSRKQPTPIPGRVASPSLAAAAPDSSLPTPVPKGTKLPRVQKMLNFIGVAHQMGLRVRENPYTDKVDPVHTKNSHHYQTIGKHKGKKVGRAIDVSGDPETMMKFFRYAEQYAGNGLDDLFHDPAGYSYDRGKKWGKTIGGHGSHVHLSIR